MKSLIDDNENDVHDSTPRFYPRRETDGATRLARLAAVILGIALLTCAAWKQAHAQATSPAGALVSSIKTGIEPLTVKLTGNFTNAFNCVASGATGFSGPRGSGGAFSINENVTLKAGEVPTLTCDGRGFAKLDWTIPNQNTDGSTLTDLYSFEIYQGSDPANLTATLTMAPTATTQTMTGVLRGTWYYGIKALAGSIAVSKPSAMSNVVNKVVVPPVLTFASDVVVSKAPTIPNPPTLTIAQVRDIVREEIAKARLVAAVN